MNRLSLLLLLILFSTTLNSLFCQESFGGRPLSETRISLAQEIPVWELPATETTDLQTKGSSHDKGQALRVGRYETVKLSTQNAGRTDRTANGDKIWRIGFRSTGAYSMSLSFTDFHIPEGAELYLYNADRSFTIGKFTSANTMDGNIFYTQDVAGDEIYVEYYEPHDADFAGSFEIDEVGICERNLFGRTKGYVGDAIGDCHIDVVCPETAGWEDQINSVVCYTYKEGIYKYMCSGAMVNNTKQDFRRYVLSAGHCYSANATNYVFYFHYQTNVCGGDFGNYSHTATGAVKRALGTIEDGTSDFLLLEITGQLGATFRDKVYFAGWDRSISVPTIGIAIHHPQGDWKKASFPKAIKQNNLRPRYWEVSWKTGSANQGTTEQGSSGSPLFNASKLIVGTLSHGQSSCSYIDEYSIGPMGKDFYGKFSWSWANNVNNHNSDTKLQPWLSPDNPNITSLNGRYYTDQTGINDAPVSTSSLKILPNPSDGNVIIKGDFKTSTGTLNLFNMVGKLIYSQEVNTQTDITLSLGGIDNGIYLLQITDGDFTHYSKLIITK